MTGLEDWEMLTIGLLGRLMIGQKFLVRHFLPTLEAVQSETMNNVFPFPDTENPADGLTEQ